MIEAKEIKRAMSSRASITGSPAGWRLTGRIFAFAACYGLLLTAFLLVGRSTLNPASTALTARSTAWVLWALGAQGRADGVLVTSTLGLMKIIPECTAVNAVMLFVAAIVAFPSTLRMKLVGMAAGVPILVLVNLVRIVSLVQLQYWRPDWFEVAHLIVWQSVLIVLTAMMWLAWAYRAAGLHNRENA